MDEKRFLVVISLVIFSVALILFCPSQIFELCHIWQNYNYLSVIITSGSIIIIIIVAFV